jgi:hypothetical protein
MKKTPSLENILPDLGNALPDLSKTLPSFDLSEAQVFDKGVRKILSVSREELAKREQEWKRQRATKAKPGPKPSSHDAERD